LLPLPVLPRVPGPRSAPIGGSLGTAVVQGVVGGKILVKNPGPSAEASSDGDQVPLLDLGADLLGGETEDRGDFLDRVSRRGRDTHGGE